ncbi:TRAM domain-containing protein [Halarchaeum salinum]|uniref:TRAM domain-containing protein n=1 Tax=Halarchaeum salinum TaxID=489912 RepID=A0AAV3SAM4_9EURY
MAPVPPVLLAAAAIVVLLVLTVLWWRSRDDASASKRAHEAAQERDPPVDIGETYEFGVTEFSDHHSGERVAVGKVEGFVVFTEDVPNTVEAGDVIRAKVMSFNRDNTSADATYEGRA